MIQSSRHASALRLQFLLDEHNQLKRNMLFPEHLQLVIIPSFLTLAAIARACKSICK